jgi:hypothetical protein
MSKDLSWIVGLMKANSEAVGFIPETTLEEDYLTTGRYILQCNEQGQRVGYLLHGLPRPGGLLVVSQHCIDMDKRLHGYGEEAFRELVERARIANCRGIKLRCAEDLESNVFWQSQGLEHVSTQHPDNRRKRAINIYLMDLWPTLFCAVGDTV